MSTTAMETELQTNIAALEMKQRTEGQQLKEHFQTTYESLQPINVQELVTFYPMFRQEPAGKVQLKVCRTLSCALGGGYELHGHLCRKLGLDAHRHGVQTTPDGKFSVEFVECLASCGTAPVMMVNEDFHEGVTPAQADEILGGGRP